MAHHDQTLPSPAHRAMHKLTRAGHIVLQIGLLTGLWLIADLISARWLPQLPPGVLGMLLLLAGLLTRRVPLGWFNLGARWLLAEMLLFFIPAVIAVVKYPQLMLHQGLAIVLVIVVSTLFVMAVTALAVDGVYRLELLWRRRHWSRPHD
ncbi:CidA/LrgA family protein [Azospira inquinata]|nr:CidA/LrgA family protein [Azospira inquinata]QWT45489.1 CidA/LrgA family protein [Azospira inquinata]